GELQQDVERAVELGKGELTHETARRNGPLDAPANSRKRQPASRLIFSCANPENDAMMRSAPLVRSKIALSVGGESMGALINSNRSVSARQASGEKRSRITDAADCAAPIR